MVLEQVLDRKYILNHIPFVFILSAVYVFIAFGVTQIFFPGESLPIVLLATILLLPSMHHLICIEEEIERTGSSDFWKRHKTILKVFLGAFLGILVGFLVLGMVNTATLSYQTGQLNAGHLKPELITEAYTPTIQTAFALFTHNLTYLLLGFVLAIFYGAGAVFLIIYNASFFAAFVIQLFEKFAAATQLAGIALVHLLPESAGFIFTAIAGATISRAIIHEKINDSHFKNVIQNAVILLILGVFFIALAAILETYVTAPLFHTLI